MTVQICEVSTAFGLVTLAAALADGLLPPADRRILVISTNTALPELSPHLTEVAGVGALFDRFDDVYSPTTSSSPLGTRRSGDRPVRTCPGSLGIWPWSGRSRTCSTCT